MKCCYTVKSHFKASPGLKPPAFKNLFVGYILSFSSETFFFIPLLSTPGYKHRALKTKFQYKMVRPGHCSAQLSINLYRVKSSREVCAFEFCAAKLLRHVVQIPESKTAIFLVFTCSTQQYSGVKFNMSKKLKVVKIAFLVVILSNSDFVVHSYSSLAAIQFYLLNNFNCTGNR